MVIRTFNVDEDTYEAYAAYCKKNGISMSKRVEHFIKEDLVKLKAGEKKEVVEKKHSTDHHMKRYC